VARIVARAPGLRRRDSSRRLFVSCQFKSKY
jgi:hypothetical protein